MTGEPYTNTGTLKDGEPHPAAYSAKEWIREYFASRDPHVAFRLMESFSSSAIEGNRLAECCGETLRRLLNGEPVGSQYVLGLVWTMRNMEEQRDPATRVEQALASAAEILANFQKREIGTTESTGDKLEQWQACYAMLFRQMNGLVQELHTLKQEKEEKVQ